jgi:hypothetical protein
MLDRLAPGDVVTVTRIDRLARSTFDLFGIVKRIVDAKGAIPITRETWADTRTSTARLERAAVRLLTRTGLDWTHKHRGDRRRFVGVRRAPSVSRRTR